MVVDILCPRVPGNELTLKVVKSAFTARFKLLYHRSG